MKQKLKILMIILFFGITNFAGEKKVLVEIFTNSHCPLCTAAYAAMDNYLQSTNGSEIEYIYYHMTFPYSDDQLYQHNPSDSQLKNTFYGPHTSTPKAYFEGNLVSNSYSNWGSNLDNLVNQTSNFDLNLSGTLDDGSFTVNADVTQTGTTVGSQFTINYVVVEDVNYSGRNGIDFHKNAMREIVNPEGDLFSISINETKRMSATIDINEVWNTENVKIIVFVQNMNTKEVFQSESISFSSLVLTDIKNDNFIRNNFSLSQNYPNPFNPSTTINYTIPGDLNEDLLGSSLVELKVYDILGKEVATIVNSRQSPGEYSFIFDATSLSAGFYYYQLKAGDFIQTRKMILLK